MLGNFGQKYTNAAEKLCEMYYLCDWDKALDAGSPKENAEIMTLLQIAIYRCQKPVHIIGCKLLVLSHANVLNVSKIESFIQIIYNILSGYQNFIVLLYVSSNDGEWRALMDIFGFIIMMFIVKWAFFIVTHLFYCDSLSRYFTLIL